MKKKVVYASLILAIIGCSGLAYANSTYFGYFSSTYPSSPLNTNPNHCLICHGSGGPPFNAYGTDFWNQPPKNAAKNATQAAAALRAIETLDSDGDGASNITEINAGSFPGDPSSIPGATAPVINSFAATPASITSGQSSTLSWTLSGGALSTLTIDNGVGSVLGSTSKSVTPGATTTYTLTASNSAGTVSQSVTVNLTAGSGAGPDMTIWVGQWFKLTTKITGSCSGSSGVVSDTGSYVGYLKLWEWDPNNQILQGDLYEYDTATAQWSSQSLPLLFIGGSDLDFLCQSQVTDNAANSTEGFTARIVGKETAGVLKSATFKSLGGYYIDALDQSGAIANCAGGLKLTGALIADSKVPVPVEVILR